MNQQFRNMDVNGRDRDYGQRTGGAQFYDYVNGAPADRQHQHYQQGGRDVTYDSAHAQGRNYEATGSTRTSIDQQRPSDRSYEAKYDGKWQGDLDSRGASNTSSTQRDTINRPGSASPAHRTSVTPDSHKVSGSYKETTSSDGKSTEASYKASDKTHTTSGVHSESTKVKESEQVKTHTTAGDTK
ncbi:hypothetical protein RvY_01813-2 [Ramazzottius varieornatus]|uniref:Uncharacterized protein n=1 Tax=Ramazzottius varieornatus TaxID=947166 RepID=A0A1D1USS7_RAMVA|nr:hypothetical protein RvY_01813-2 [Ramazzottius varieornatus]